MREKQAVARCDSSAAYQSVSSDTVWEREREEASRRRQTEESREPERKEKLPYLVVVCVARQRLCRVGERQQESDDQHTVGLWRLPGEIRQQKPAGNHRESGRESEIERLQRFTMMISVCDCKV